ncbi:MAG: ligase-associated DNA damage response endonuclease PdeM [Acetobacteraceae bacterium]|nr:ligase-associated DNA damage response endonuclease PdeM [Acetobacteraceae bacterium]
MSAAPIHLGAERLMLDPGGAVLWPAQRLMAVADLHLEKGSAAAARGSLLPPWDSAATLDRLALLLRRHRPATTILLGDSFHDRTGAARLPAAERARLAHFAQATSLVWVLGNHDPEAPADLPGTAMAELAIGPLTFRHQALPTARHEVSGHFHPKASIPARGATVSRPCFVADSRRLILPALGAYTGGLDVHAPAIATLFPRGGRVFLLGQQRLYSFPFAGRAAARLPTSQPALIP